jgi:hypothetical protein
MEEVLVCKTTKVFFWIYSPLDCIVLVQVSFSAQNFYPTYSDCCRSIGLGISACHINVIFRAFAGASYGRALHRPPIVIAL